LAKTAGRRSWWLLLGLGLVGTLQPLGCSEPADDNAIDPAAITEVLQQVGPQAVVPTLEAFLTRADLLEGAIAVWVTAASVDDREAARDTAQAAFLEAMAFWQQAEIHQIGPSGPSLNTLGGADLRDEIYSWPTVNPCRVDQETVEADWDEADFYEINLVNSYGLDALEHLLFAGVENACPSQVDINADGTWDALASEGVDASRAAFAHELVRNVIATTEALLLEWEDGFADTLATAAEGNAVYSDAQEGLNAVYDALFYLETQTKDRKLAKPLGLSGCSQATCIDDVEGLSAGDSVARIENNLIGFRVLFSGGEGHGIDDLLDEVGHGDLAAQILTDTDTAIARASALDGPLDALIDTDAQAAMTLYEDVKRVTDAIKGELRAVLTLQIPTEAAGDAD